MWQAAPSSPPTVPSVSTQKRSGTSSLPSSNIKTSGITTDPGCFCIHQSNKYRFIDQSLPLGEGAPKGRMRVEQIRLMDRNRKFKRLDLPSSVKNQRFLPAPEPLLSATRTFSPLTGKSSPRGSLYGTTSNRSLNRNLKAQKEMYMTKPICGDPQIGCFLIILIKDLSQLQTGVPAAGEIDSPVAAEHQQLVVTVVLNQLSVAAQFQIS